MRKKTLKYSKLLSDLISRSDKIVLVCHQNPDGDAIGSMMGLARYLVRKGKKPVMLSPDGLPEFLVWMKNSQAIIIHDNEPGRAVMSIKEADLLILLDFNHVDRSGKLKDHILSSAAKKILIDHHPDPSPDVDLLISEPGFSSTAELVFSLVGNMEGDYFLDEEFMEAIYVGMMTDTGNFTYGTITGDTLREVAIMMDRGLNRDYIAGRVYDNFSIDRLHLQGFASYERLVYMEEAGTAYIYLTRADLDRFKHKIGDTEGFVNIPFSVRGVRLSALFIEKENHIKISFRSKGDIDVNLLASKYFTGGGHKNAAGARYRGTMKECLKYFEELISSGAHLTI